MQRPAYLLSTVAALALVLPVGAQVVRLNAPNASLAEESKSGQYDVFDASGHRILSVELPAGRRIVGIGRQNIYVVAESEFGIQHIERYTMPW